MRILIGCYQFKTRTGMPNYLLTLARELMNCGHQVAIIAMIGEVGLVSPEIIPQYKLKEYDRSLHEFHPDVLLLNEPESEELLNMYPNVPAYQIIHSALFYDRPILRQPQINRYISPRPQITAWLLGQGIPEKSIIEISLPVDIEHFRQPVVRQHGRYDIVSISTIDELRKPMLLDLIRQAKAGKKVLIAGKDHGSLGDLSQYADIATLKIIPEEIRDVRPFLASAKMVAGIYRGLITLEAKVMGIPCLIYDEHGKSRIEKPDDVRVHDVRKIARQFVDLFTEIRADIIIPHHDRDDLLADCLKSIPKLNFNVIVADYGGSFSMNCNAGARKGRSSNLIFLNDDTIVNAPAMWELAARDDDVVGCRQTFTQPEMATGLKTVLGITLRINKTTGIVQYWLTDTPAEVFYPSGAIFKIKRDLFRKLGGFSERFINGGEDQDLFLRCIAAGAKMSFCPLPITHHLSQSEGRFKYCAENDVLLKDRWPDSKLKEMFKLC